MKALPKVRVTPDLKEYYRKIGAFLKAHPQIKSRKLALGFEVDISTIPQELVDEWLAVCLI